MKRFIAIALIGLFSVLLSGSVYASFNDNVNVELKKGWDKLHINLIHDVNTPNVTPNYGHAITVISENDSESGFISDIERRANSPPLTKYRC